MAHLMVVLPCPASALDSLGQSDEAGTSLTPAVAQSIVERIEPGLSVVDLVELHGGDISRVYEVKLAGEVPSLVIKIYPEVFHWKLAKEVSIYRRLAERPSLPVPGVVLHDDSKAVVPLSLLVMTKIEGRVLRPLEPSLADDDLFDLYAQMGRTLRSFHDVHMEAFGYLVAEGVLDPHATNEAYVLFQFSKKLKEFRDLGGDLQLADRMERHVASHASRLKDCACPVFCHDDFHTPNVIVEKAPHGKWRLSGVVDVENAVAGDPLLDVAKTLPRSLPARGTAARPPIGRSRRTRHLTVSSLGAPLRLPLPE